MNASELVLARVYRSAADRNSAGNVAVLVWPLEPFNTYPGAVTCWHFYGQHSGADLGYLIRATRQATAAEATEAITEWRRQGPGRTAKEMPLTVRQRAPAYAVIMAAHRAALQARLDKES